MPPRLPDPGTPAYTAQADQFDAAQQHATRQAVALLHAGAILVAPTGPWAARMLDSVRPGHPGRQTCRHLRDADGPMPMFVIEPGTIRCRPTLDPAERGCAGCGRVQPGLFPHRAHVAQRGLLVAHARLCFSCSVFEHRAFEHRPEGSR